MTFWDYANIHPYMAFFGFWILCFTIASLGESLATASWGRK